jgi:TetR/AcrR family transcriptional regulator, regulator of cefoperazone and chloramphenicol sensitivity
MAGKTDDTRTRLLEAAGEVFAERGFQAATVREICSRAGANLAAINYYFGDKQRLYLEVVGYARQGISDGSLVEFPPGISAGDKLRLILEEALAGLEQGNECPAWGRRLMIREMAEPSEAWEALVDAFARPKFEGLDRILAELLPPETPEAQRRMIGFSIAGQCLFHWLYRPVAAILLGADSGNLDAARVADHIVRFTLAALGLGPPVVATGTMEFGDHARRVPLPLGEGTC